MGWGTPSAVWVVMGRGPRLPRHGGAGMSISPWLGGEAPGIPACCRLWVPGWWDSVHKEPSASLLCWDSPSQGSQELCMCL